MKRIDSYGRAEGEALYRSNAALQPIETDNTRGIAYLRFAEGTGPIHRIAPSESGLLLVTWAWGRWEDREALEYIPDERTREVDA